MISAAQSKQETKSVQNGRDHQSCLHVYCRSLSGLPVLKLKAQAIHDYRPSSLNTPLIELTVYCYSITAGNIEILPGKAKANVCSGDNVTFEAGILSSLDILNIYWFQMPPKSVPIHLSKNDEHFTMFTNLTYSSLHIRNTLPSLSSDYLLSVRDPNSDLWDNVVFNLKAQGKIDFIQYLFIEQLKCADVNIVLNFLSSHGVIFGVLKSICVTLGVRAEVWASYFFCILMAESKSSSIKEEIKA